MKFQKKFISSYRRYKVFFCGKADQPFFNPKFIAKEISQISFFFRGNKLKHTQNHMAQVRLDYQREIVGQRGRTIARQAFMQGQGEVFRRNHLIRLAESIKTKQSIVSIVMFSQSNFLLFCLKTQTLSLKILSVVRHPDFSSQGCLPQYKLLAFLLRLFSRHIFP